VLGSLLAVHLSRASCCIAHARLLRGERGGHGGHGGSLPGAAAAAAGNPHSSPPAFNPPPPSALTPPLPSAAEAHSSMRAVSHLLLAVRSLAVRTESEGQGQGGRGDGGVWGYEAGELLALLDEYGAAAAQVQQRLLAELPLPSPPPPQDGYGGSEQGGYAAEAGAGTGPTTKWRRKKAKASK
jgi:hypothetical protein